MTSFLLLMRLLVLHGVADTFAVWLMENYGKVSSVTVVLRKYQASQMPSSKEP